MKVSGTMAGSGYKDYFQVLGVDRSANADEIASNEQALATRLSEAEMAWLDLRSEER